MAIGLKIHHPHLGRGVIATGFKKKRGGANQHRIDFGQGPVSVNLKQFKHAEWQVRGEKGDPVITIVSSLSPQETTAQPEQPEMSTGGAENLGAENLGGDLSNALQSARLSHYEAALRELGAAFVEDLKDVDEADLTKLGMKRVEIRRMQHLNA